MPDTSPPDVIRRPTRPTDRLQGWVARILFALLRLLPLTWASGLGGWLGRTLGPRLSASERARENLRAVFPKMTEAEVAVTIRGMWDNLLRTAFECPHINRMRLYEDNRFEVVGAENIDHLRDDGKPGIFFSGHFANWELMPLSTAQRGQPAHLVYRAPNNPAVDWLFRQRMPWDAELIPKGPTGARQLLRVLKNGDHVGMLVDQKMNDGINVPFFGRDAMTAPALAKLALKFQCPVVPIRVERLGGAKFRITLFEPLELPDSGDRQADVLALMTQVNELFETWIRQRPEQWLWLHRRWGK